MSGAIPTLPLYAFKACTGTVSVFLPVIFTQNNSMSVTNEKSISDRLLSLIVAVLPCEPAGTRICDAKLGRIEAGGRISRAIKKWTVMCLARGP